MSLYPEHDHYLRAERFVKTVNNSRLGEYVCAELVDKAEALTRQLDATRELPYAQPVHLSESERIAQFVMKVQKRAAIYDQQTSLYQVVVCEMKAPRVLCDRALQQIEILARAPDVQGAIRYDTIYERNIPKSPAISRYADVVFWAREW